MFRQLAHEPLVQFGVFRTNRPHGDIGATSRRHDLGLGGWSLSVLHSYDPGGRTLYLGNGDQRSITAANGSSLPGSSLLGSFIAAEDGSEIYIFAGNGRHLRTLDALTGSVRFQFTYNSAGRLATITDSDANVTTIERDGSENPSAIIAPFSQRTTLAVDDDGYLSRITNPAGEAVRLTYQGVQIKGLLTTLTNPRGHTHRYLYDPASGLFRDESPTGGAITLSRSDMTEDHYSVTLTRASGRATTYEVEELPTGETLRRIDRNGVRTESAATESQYFTAETIISIHAKLADFMKQTPIRLLRRVALPIKLEGLLLRVTLKRKILRLDQMGPLV